MADDRQKEDQLEQLYREMHKTLFAYAKSVLRDDSFAEEAVQDTFCICHLVPDEKEVFPMGK